MAMFYSEFWRKAYIYFRDTGNGVVHMAKITGWGAGNGASIGADGKHVSSAEAGHDWRTNIA